MNQKMIDLGISSSYLAECCGVGKYYLNECLNGSKSHKMTGKLKQKIEGVFRSIEISKHKQEREQKPTETFAPALSSNMDYEKGMLEGIKIARKAIVDAINNNATNQNSEAVIYAIASSTMFELSAVTERIIEKLFGTNTEE